MATMTILETADEWVALGTRVHGGFGSFIPLGIRIGLDAGLGLAAGPRQLSVCYRSAAESRTPSVKRPTPRFATSALLAYSRACDDHTHLQTCHRVVRLRFNILLVDDARESRAAGFFKLYHEL
jgi:hypothetical protein